MMPMFNHMGVPRARSASLEGPKQFTLYVFLPKAPEHFMKASGAIMAFPWVFWVLFGWQF